MTTAIQSTFAVNVSQSALNAALQLSASVVEKRSTIPILSCIKLEAESRHLRITATDMNIDIIQSIEADVNGPGGIAVEADRLMSIVKLCDGDIALTIDQESGQLKIQSGTAKWQLRAQSAQDFPLQRDPAVGDSIELPGDMFRSALSSVQYAITHEETRFQLNGVFIGASAKKGRLDVVATNGHCMAILDLSTDAPRESLLIPKKLVSAIAKLPQGTLTLSSDKDTVSVRQGSVAFNTRRIDVNFPNYRAVVAVLPHVARVDRERLVTAVKRAMSTANERTRATRLDFSPGQLRVSAMNPELGSSDDRVPIDYSGPQMFVGVNASYVLDALAGFQDETVAFHLEDERTQIHITHTSPHELMNSMHVVMPMHLG